MSDRTGNPNSDWEAAMRHARVAVHGPDGRGMIGNGRRHLDERGARAIIEAERRAIAALSNPMEAPHV